LYPWRNQQWHPQQSKSSRLDRRRLCLHAQSPGTIFNADDQLQVAGHAKDGREAIALAESLKPDVITMDINMPTWTVCRPPRRS